MPGIPLKGVPENLYRNIGYAAIRNRRSVNDEIIARLDASFPANPDRDDAIQNADERDRSTVIVVDTNLMMQLVMKGPHSKDADLLIDLDREWAAPTI